MTAAPVPGNAPVSTSGVPAPGRLARQAVVLATVVAAVTAALWSVFGIALAFGGWDAVEDNWVGFLAAVALIGGPLVSLIAFVLAVVAKARHEAAPRLWLPLSLFPALFAFVVLGEAFLWE